MPSAIFKPVNRVALPGGAKTKQEDQSKTQSLLLQSASAKFAQVEIQAHWKFGGDLDSCGDRLRDFFGRWDLTEPSQRYTIGSLASQSQ